MIPAEQSLIDHLAGEEEGRVHYGVLQQRADRELAYWLSVAPDRRTRRRLRKAHRNYDGGPVIRWAW